MAFYFIITTSAFIEWSSESDTETAIATRKLFDKLRLIASDDKENKVVVTQKTDDCIKQVIESLGEEAEENLWAYKFISSYYEVINNYKEGEIDSVIQLALKKYKLFDEVIIINGSNIYDGEEDITGIPNIKVMNEKDALNFVIKKGHN